MNLLVKNGKYFDVYTGDYSKRDIIITDGIISQIGTELQVVGKVIDAEGLLIFPGFIDAHSHIGMWRNSKGGNDCNECTRPVTPTVKAVDGVNLKDEYFYQGLKAGFTTSMITPGSGNAVCGQAAIIKHCVGHVDEMVIDEYAAMKIAFGENPKGVYGGFKKSPASRMGTFSIIDETLHKAKMYIESKAKDDYEFEPFRKVFDKEVPLKIHAHRSDDIRNGIRVARKYGLNCTIDHCTEGYKINENMGNVPLLLGPLKLFKSKYETKEGTTKNVQILIDKGYQVSITSDHPFLNIEYLPSVIGLLVKEGLDFTEAIRTITINPAMAIGLGKSIGSIEVGKSGDLVIFDGSPLEARSNLVYALIQGRIYYEEA